ncbi:MAG: lipid A deacylase LpxR family protein [Alphaproteobacteria bacterium]|nr:lipid A deacylase LpxR family protein [Alphaproteobacteria bacterium]
MALPVAPPPAPAPLKDPAVAAAEAPKEVAKGTFSLTYENDIFTGSDKGYTNGVRGSWTTAADDEPRVLRPLLKVMPMFPDEGSKRVSYAIGQSMFTPEDIETPVLQVGDRPYAGWLYGSMGLINDTGTQLDTLELTLGIIGPYSFAEQTQEFVHDNITDSPHPMGWQHQLDTEPGIIISYDRKWRSYLQLGMLGHGIDFTPNLGASIGNVQTDARVGATLRLGKNLPADYGPPRVRPSLSGSDFFLPTQSFSWYLFGGVEGRAVGRNIFLDGNTFGDSNSTVDKEYFVGDVQAGVAFTYQTWRVAYTHVFRTKEYETQDEAESFGALTLSHQF